MYVKTEKATIRQWIREIEQLKKENKELRESNETQYELIKKLLMTEKQKREIMRKWAIASTKIIEKLEIRIEELEKDNKELKEKLERIKKAYIEFEKAETEYDKKLAVLDKLIMNR